MSEGAPFNETISPNDKMFGGHLAHYFGVARSAITAIRAAQALRALDSVQRILDFACGHGRVMRALRAHYPNAEIIGCDTDEDGLAFCRDTFGSRSVLASAAFEDLPIEPGIDLIWVGSLVTHLPEADAARLLRFLISRLSEKGLLVVSTHGRKVAENMRNRVEYGIPPEGVETLLQTFSASRYAYVDYPWQPGYGVSIVPPGWFFTWCRSHGARLLMYSERAWDNHHDIVAITRP